MLWVPKKGILRHETDSSGVGAATPGTVVTTGASANTKGSWAQMIASTAFDAYLVMIQANNYGTGAVACQGCIDIGIGAATEEVLIPDLLMGHCGYIGNAAGQGPKCWLFPLYIPAGTRIACRAAGARTSQAFSVGIHLWGGDGCPPFRVGSKVTTYGMGTVPAGTTITPGASAAEGAWTQVSASTSEDHFAFFPSFQVTGDTTVNNRNLNVDIGIGSATEEQIGGPWYFSTDANESMQGPLPCMPCFADVPAGTRLVMRASNNGTNDAGYNGVIHAVS